MADETYNIKLSGEALAEIKRRADAEGISVNEYIKRAVGLRAFFADELKSPDKDILLRNKRNQQYQVLDVLDGTDG